MEVNSLTTLLDLLAANIRTSYKKEIILLLNHLTVNSDFNQLTKAMSEDHRNKN